MTDAPFKQGSLDAFCGLYSIVNALKYVGRRKANRQALDAALWAAVDRLGPQRFFEAFHNRKEGGMTCELLLEALPAALNEFSNKTKIKVSFSRFCADGYSLKSFWNEVEEGLVSKNKALILSISGRIDHWTVAIAATKGLISLKDSDEMSLIRKSSSKIRNGSTAPRKQGGSTNVLHAHECVWITRETS